MQILKVRDKTMDNYTIEADDLTTTALLEREAAFLESADSSWPDLPANPKSGAIYPGRFQIFHKGHMKVTSKMEGDVKVVYVVHTGKVTEKSPFSYNTVSTIITSVLGRMFIVKQAKNAYLPELVREQREAGVNVTKVYASDDRVDEYRKQFDRLAKAKPDLGINIEIVQIPRSDDGISATKVRQALFDNDGKAFNELVPQAMQRTYLPLRKELLDVVGKD